MHGLYWLTLNLAERCPLLMVIDDAHWADPASLRFLSYLAGRLEGTAVLAVAATREEDGKGTCGDALGVVARELSTRVVRLKPLSGAATAELVAYEYGERVAPAFARACHQATGGNPFFLRELVRALRADGIDPTPAAVSRVTQEGPASVARSVLTRIAGLAPSAAVVARALAVLGGEADVGDLARLCSVDEQTVGDAVDLLTRAGIVSGSEPLTFVHPIVQSSIYGDIPVSARRRAHSHAARLLASDGAAAERVAAHLVPTRPTGAPWTASVLSQAAGDALSRGAPEAAVAYLGRALAEPPAFRDRCRVLVLLGHAEYLAGQPGAAAHLLEAMNATPTAVDRGELALQAAKALIMAEPDRSEEAIQLLDRAIAELGEHDPQLSMRLEAQVLAAAGLKLSTRPLHRDRMDGLYRRALGDGPAERLLLANLAVWSLIEGCTPGRFSDLGRHARAGGSPAEVARMVAERAIGDGALLREEGADSELFYLPIVTLYMADVFDRCQYWLEEAIEDARKRGSVLGFAQASAALAEVAYRRGDLATAEAHARDTAAVSQGDSLAVQINVLLEQGRLDEAERLLGPYPLPPQADHFMLQPIQAAAARLKVAQKRTDEGAQQLLACGQWLETWGAKNPSVVAWRSSAAMALNQYGDERARDLAGEEVVLARALGQPRALGIALRALGLLEHGSNGINLLEDSVMELERSSARLEHARALIEHGAALRRGGHRADSRRPLREGIDLAHRCGAIALTARGRQELLATGARPRRQVFRGRDALTPTEARVADMATQGLSTPEIAQALFVTPKTVETHLGHTYQKLGIHCRAELTRALSEPRSV